MSDDIAQKIEESYRAKDDDQRRKNFLARMGHKLHAKERRFAR
jgi:hypothetical protein